MREPLLHSILTQPSAPFRERHVIAEITRILDDGGVPWFSDPVGNLVVGASSRKEYERLLADRAAVKSGEPLRVYIAHMDHPGFHGTGFNDRGELEFKWHGGSPTKNLVGAKVWLATPLGFAGHGVITECKMLESGRAVESGVIKLDAKMSGAASEADDYYGGVSFRAPVWQEDRLIYTKAADDLVGCFAVVSIALDLVKQKKLGAKAGKKAVPFIGLLTRAEEVGFIGAIGHFELGWIQKARRPLLFVSLETSRALPGAEIGKGPVVRLGDRFTVFHAPSLRVFGQIAEKRLSGRYQKRVMDGGTCEATTAISYGYPCVGISVPLGNYHNQGIELGPDSRGPDGPAPEFVHLDDVAGLIELCHALLEPKLPWKAPFAERVKGFKKELKSYRPLLRSGP